MMRDNDAHSRLFHSSARRYEENVRQGAITRAVRAQVATTDGDSVPGVAVFVGTQVRTVLLEDDAWRLTHEIADALESSP
ncbi:hypothetical protein GCM10022200_05550 [Microbacterium awajiense]|uniref:Uncharacterized protein n=1 Tax=Microbacterium awajiense TaxID=415214 RepID=A0ABP7A6Y7_9MICO